MKALFSEKVSLTYSNNDRACALNICNQAGQKGYQTEKFDGDGQEDCKTRQIWFVRKQKEKENSACPYLIQITFTSEYAFY